MGSIEKAIAGARQRHGKIVMPEMDGPVCDLSRGASVDDIFAAAALSLAMV